MTTKKPDPLRFLVWGIDQAKTWHIVWGGNVITINSCNEWVGNISVTDPAGNGLPPEGAKKCATCRAYVTKLIVEES